MNVEVDRADSKNSIPIHFQSFHWSTLKPRWVPLQHKSSVNPRSTTSIMPVATTVDDDTAISTSFELRCLSLSSIHSVHSHQFFAFDDYLIQYTLSLCDLETIREYGSWLSTHLSDDNLRHTYWASNPDHGIYRNIIMIYSPCRTIVLRITQIWVKHHCQDVVIRELSSIVSVPQPCLTQTTLTSNPAAHHNGLSTREKCCGRITLEKFHLSALNREISRSWQRRICPLAAGEC